MVPSKCGADQFVCVNNQNPAELYLQNTLQIWKMYKGIKTSENLKDIKLAQTGC
jgi:hypothetical protein